MPSQRKRGASFCVDYRETLIDASSPMAVNSPSLRRSPPLTHDGDFLIPAKSVNMLDRITVVLDLDETLVYARNGPLYVRPGIEELMSFLAQNCETVVWTSSIHSYADAVISQIDTASAVQHVIYRHSRWCNSRKSGKDLQLLGRDLDQTIIIENTPDCLRNYECNGVLVEDYDGGELEDNTLFCVLNMLRDLVERRRMYGTTVPEYIRSCPFVSSQLVPTDKGDCMKCYCLQAWDVALDEDDEDDDYDDYDDDYHVISAAYPHLPKPQTTHISHSHRSHVLPGLPSKLVSMDMLKSVAEQLEQMQTKDRGTPQRRIITA